MKKITAALAAALVLVCAWTALAADTDVRLGPVMMQQSTLVVGESTEAVVELEPVGTELPDGMRIEWTVDNLAASVRAERGDPAVAVVTAHASDPAVTVTATLYDENGAQVGEPSSDLLGIEGTALPFWAGLTIAVGAVVVVIAVVAAVARKKRKGAPGA